MNVVGKALTVLSLMGFSQTQAQVSLTPDSSSTDTCEWVHRPDNSFGSDTLVLQGDGCYGERILRATREAADSYREKKGERLCYRYVKQGLSSALGLSLTGVSAYKAADQLAGSIYFEETPVKHLKLEALPQGSVVVWNRSKQHPHGHISVSDGQGQEVSDRVRPQIRNYGTSLRVFVPVCQLATR